MSDFNTVTTYALEERIGSPELFVGREKEFRLFHKWLKGIPKKLSKSRAILARKKSGKTAFVQRMFNQLWSANGEVIPFYLNISEKRVWYPQFAIHYYRVFASQYISFMERDQDLVGKPLTLEQIREYGQTKSMPIFVDDVDSLLRDKERGLHDAVWDTAYRAPHQYAAVLDQRFLVIIDEFQNLNEFVYRDERCETSPERTLAGSYHDLSESKIAPMLITGSYIGWILNIIGRYLEAGRVKITKFFPMLAEEEGLQAVYKYAEFYDEPITNETALQINQLCSSDPFFISCVIQSDYEEKDLTTADGVVNTINYEVSDKDAEMFRTWGEYIDMAVKRINDTHAKDILLWMSKHADREWTPKELKDTLTLELSPTQIHERLELLAEADVIERGVSDIRYHGLQDGTMNLILRNRFEEEIKTYAPDLRKDLHAQITQLTTDKHRLQGTLNNLAGKFAELQLAGEFRSKKRFRLSEYFEGISDTTRLNLSDVRLRETFQRPDGKGQEFDVVAESTCGRVVVVEVKKTQDPIGRPELEEFWEKLAVYIALHPDKTLLPVVLSVGGFTEPARRFCDDHAIGTAETIPYFSNKKN